MELLLETKAYSSKGHTYFRIHIPSRVSDSLGLLEGDQLLVEIKEIQRPNTTIKKLNVRQTALED